MTCNPKGRPDRYHRIVAVCMTIDSHDPVYVYDLAASMVSAGHALDYPPYSRRYYTSREAQAREEREGMWAGEFQRPWEWRVWDRGRQDNYWSGSINNDATDPDASSPMLTEPSFGLCQAWLS